MSRSNATSLVLAALVALSLTSASTTAGSAAAPPEPGWLLTPATHPHTIPPDQGDAGRPALRDTTATGR